MKVWCRIWGSSEKVVVRNQQARATAAKLSTIQILGCHKTFVLKDGRCCGGTRASMSGMKLSKALGSCKTGLMATGDSIEDEDDSSSSSSRTAARGGNNGNWEGMRMMEKVFEFCLSPPGWIVLRQVERFHNHSRILLLVEQNDATAPLVVFDVASFGSECPPLLPRMTQQDGGDLVVRMEEFRPRCGHSDKAQENFVKCHFYSMRQRGNA